LSFPVTYRVCGPSFTPSVALLTVQLVPVRVNAVNAPPFRLYSSVAGSTPLPVSVAVPESVAVAVTKDSPLPGAVTANTGGVVSMRTVFDVTVVFPKASTTVKVYTYNPSSPLPSSSTLWL